jgi:hypothetical protein
MDKNRRFMMNDKDSAARRIPAPSLGQRLGFRRQGGRGGIGEAGNRAHFRRKRVFG